MQQGPPIPENFNIDQNKYAWGTVNIELGELSGINTRGAWRTINTHV